MKRILECSEVRAVMPVGRGARLSLFERLVDDIHTKVERFLTEKDCFAIVVVSKNLQPRYFEIIKRRIFSRFAKTSEKLGVSLSVERLALEVPSFSLLTLGRECKSFVGLSFSAEHRGMVIRGLLQSRNIDLARRFFYPLRLRREQLLMDQVRLLALASKFDLEGELEVIKCTGWDEKIISKEECTLAEKEKVHLYIQEQLLNLIYEYLYSGEHIEFAFECLKQITVFKKNKYLADISSSVFVGDREGLLRYRQILHASHQYIPALTVQELDDLLQLLDERIWMMDRLVIVPLLESGVEADVDSAFEYMKKIDSECGKTSLLEYLVDMDTDGSLCGRLKTIFNDARYSEEITIAVDIKLVDSLLVNDTPETRSPLFNYLIVIDKYGSFARKDAVIDNLECMDQGELLQVLEDQGYFKEVFERHKMLYEKHLPEGGGGGAKGLEE